VATIFTPNERQVVEKTSVILARTIRAAILDGRLEPNQPLPEVELARQLGTSRTPIREALLLLEREGLIEAAPNRGSTVKGYVPAELEELYTLRAVLEGHAARTAAERITEAELGLLDQSCDRFRELRTSEADLTELFDENFRFHEVILRAAHSGRLIRMVREVTAVPPIYRSYMAYSEDNRRTVETAHRGITEALRRRDPEDAAERMRVHVLWARDLAMRHFPRNS
jgi:DNA-binding GntR family transcriptional regulator